MSIIERALEKRRTAGDEAGRPDLRTAPRPRDASEPATARQLTGRVPSESLHLDMEALRAAGLLPPPEFSDRLTEQVRRIKWPLLEAVVGRGDAGASAGNAVMVTSSIAGEGKTFVCFNLALSIAREKDLDVLLVDADVAKRHLTQLLGADGRVGLTEAGADASLDPEQLVVGTGIAGFSFLPSGQRSLLASELFASRRMADVIDALRRTDPQRIVLFDCSPLLATSETAVLASRMDQIVLVVHAEHTPQPVVLEAVSLLDRSKQIRCVLNQTRMSPVNEYYYYGYPTNERPAQP
jgi:protein-tyrosine kinase